MRVKAMMKHQAPRKPATTELGLLLEALRHPIEHRDILGWLGVSGACGTCFALVHIFI